MKKRLPFIAVAIFTLLLTLTLSACDFIFDSDGDSEGDGVEELTEYTPKAGEFFREGESYYKSNKIALVTEIYGKYTFSRHFYLDAEDESKRIYPNIYFYEEDFFQLLHYKDNPDFGDVVARLSDEGDGEFAEIEYTDKGNPLQVNIKKAGIYDLILDSETLKVDMVKVGDIETPAYETVESCDMNIHSQISHFYVNMLLDTESDEYYAELDIPLGSTISFHSDSHNSEYKLNVDESVINRLAYCNAAGDSTVYLHAGGKYKISFNRESYFVKIELKNPEEAEYFCQVGFNENGTLAPDADKPYIFKYEFLAEGRENDPYVDLPRLYPKLGLYYKLTPVYDEGVVLYDSYVVGGSEYLLTVNLKDYTLKVEPNS